MQAQRNKKRILVASKPETAPIILAALGPDFDVRACSRLDDARRLLVQGGDLVLCTLLFDDSRMFELLRHVRGDPALRNLPFVAMKISDGMLSPDTLRTVIKAAKLLGTTAFIDLSEWKRDSGPKEAEAKLRAILHDLLGKPVS